LLAIAAKLVSYNPSKDFNTSVNVLTGNPVSGDSRPMMRVISGNNIFASIPVINNTSNIMKP